MNDNTIITRDSYIFDVADSSVEVPEPDIINDPLDSLVIGYEDLTAKQLYAWYGLDGRRYDLSGPPPQQFSNNGSLGRLTNVTEAQLQQIINTAKREAAAAKTRYKRSQPYEFLLSPITGSNPLGILQPGVHLTLPPEKFEVTREQQARTFTAINGVEYSLPGPRTLASISLEGMLPMWVYGHGKPAYLPGFITPNEYRKPRDLAALLTRIQTKGQPMRLNIGPHNGGTLRQQGGGLIYDMFVTIVSFTYGEAFGHPGDYVFSMQLKEWRPIMPTPKVRQSATRETVTNATAPTGNSAPQGISDAPQDITKPPEITSKSPVTRPDQTTYVIKQGDTLYDIAANLMGSGTLWPQLYRMNKKTIDDECKRRGSSTYPRGWHIWPGTKLVIPPKGQRDAS